MKHEPLQWRWIKQNRRVRNRAEPLYAPAGRALEGASSATSQQRAKLSAALADLMDLGLESRWSVHAFERGVLTLSVHQSRYLETARIRWALDVLERVHLTCPDCNVRQVRFIASSQNCRSIHARLQTRNREQVDQNADSRI